MQVDLGDRERPPYIRFEQRAVEVRLPAEAGGGISYKDVDYILVQHIGSRDVFEQRVDRFFTESERQVAAGKLRKEFLEHYRKSYEAWRTGQEPPPTGLDVRNWPAISKAELAQLQAAKVRTVEDVAVANEEALQAIGLGARSLKTRAQDWLKHQRGAKLSLELDALRKQVEALTQQNQILQEKFRAVVAEQEVAKPEPRTSSDDTIDRLLG